jgi:lipoate-protein ligase A
MAVDEAILEAVGRAEVLPTLRLYGWNPPCLSLGVAQPADDVNMSALGIQKWDLVRRPTGGRAILHGDELTYSVIGPPTEPRLAGGILGSYRVLSGALLRALHVLGIPAKAEEEPVSTRSTNEISGQKDQYQTTQVASKNPVENTQNPVCFEVPSNYEITVDHKKLIGSAQARRKDGVLQHGSLPLYGDLTRIIKVLHFSNNAAKVRAAERLVARATTVESILNEVIPWETAAEAFVSAFKEVLNLDLRVGGLTEAEIIRVNEFNQEKYSNRTWTMRV